jgi:phenylacetate-CoA ligase
MLPSRYVIRGHEKRTSHFLSVDFEPQSGRQAPTLPLRSPADQLRSAGEALLLGVAGTLVGLKFPALLKEMKRAQWLAQSELLARAEPRLAHLLRHAAEKVPFYRDIYERLGLAPNDLRTLQDLQRLPVVSKATFLSEPAKRFLASGTPPYASVTTVTSGSTGEPFAFELDRGKLPRIFASHIFYDSWYGVRPFHRGMRIGSPSSPPSPLPSEMPIGFRLRQEVSRRLQHLYESLTLRKIKLWSFDEQQAADIYGDIEAVRPVYVYSGASTLAALADILLRQDLSLHHPPKCVISIAETMTPLRRRLIETYFKAPIVNRYGLREQGYWCAQSCPESPEHFHVNTELVVLEVVRQDGSPAPPGEIGRIVITDPFNFSMPFIRYETGDMGVIEAGPCSCGRGFPRLGPIDGRSHECIRTPSGKIVTPARWSHFLFVHKTEYAEAVRQYQLLWQPPDRARLTIVPSERFDDEVQKRLRDDLAWLLGDDVLVSVEKVTAIPPEKSGKRPIVKILGQ